MFGNKSDAAMRRIRRECADGRRIANRQVDGLTWDQVERMAATLEASDTKVGLRDSALVRVMSDGLLRIGEAVAINVKICTAVRWTFQAARRIRTGRVLLHI